MKTRNFLLVILCLLAVFAVNRDDTTQAQADEPAEDPLSQVYVTTQDFTVLRAGPGQLWERLTVLPPGATLRATGRTFDASWFQVAYTGELEEGVTDGATIDGVTYGWVAYWLLIWTGDVLRLPLGGVETLSYARRSGPTVVIGPNSYYYVDEVDPSRQVIDTVDAPVEVELTGRIGSPQAGYYWVQFRLNGEYYWTGTWEVGSNFRHTRLLDGVYLYPYRRLLTQARVELSRVGGRLSAIGSRWRALASGQPTTCNGIPPRIALDEDNLRPQDVNSEPLYQPMAAALNESIIEINAAIDLFREVCNSESRVVAATDIQTALVHIEEAERKLNLAQTLLPTYERRDPVLGTSSN